MTRGFAPFGRDGGKTRGRVNPPLSLAVNFNIAGGTIMGHPNGPFIVLNHKNDGELPEGCHVEAFEKLTVIAGTITEECC